MTVATASLNKTRSSSLEKPSDLPHQLLVEHFKTLYRTMCSEDLQKELFETVYREDLEFKDSFHCIEGRDSFFNYCAELYENLSACEFEFHDHWINEGQAMLTWTMTYQHPKLNNGANILVQGATHLRFEEQVYFHQDYFDGGALLYEHVPVLGKIIKQLKKRMV
ncbi:MAG: nuclear transport factor 2 family protein [Oleiphilus sp.]